MNANDIRLVLPPSPRTVLHWFDFICPFCYLGQQRNQILSRHGLEIVHLPFQIHPDIPPEGVEAGPRDGPMYQALEREAAQTGLSLNWPPRLPGTRTALAAAEWVRRHRPDASDEFNRALFAAHFELSEDLGDTAVIMRHASEAGIDTKVLRSALADGSAQAFLAETESAGARFGVQATPTWLIAGEMVSGLRPESEFETLARKAMRQAG
ncbi:MAG TPA: DsbA family protein [Streptosporangiaceae bacterium]|jgi:predicted DsbA family dithiol-disulfide isomerase